MPVQSYIHLYQDLVQKIWDRMVELVGYHTVAVLIQRAVWLTREKYGEAERICCSDEGIVLKDLAELEPAQLKSLMEEFISSLISILTRLVGEELVQALTREIIPDIEQGKKE